MARREPPLVPHLRGFGTTIFAEMSALAVATGSINLGQGFPDTDGPSEVADAAVEAIRAGHNQYPPGPGIPALRAAIARHQARFWGIEVDADREVLVTAGATEALAAALLALCDDGDEVVAVEPVYDSYRAAVAMAGATLRVVTLEAPDWTLDLDGLAAAVTPATRVLLLNSPHNPTGKVFSEAELSAIASVCVERDLVAIADEVYEHITFDDHVHRPLSTFPGMAERTLSISSAGKTFSFTGWKVGWATGPAPLVDATRTTKQFLTFVSSGPFQHAVAVGLDLPDSYFTGLASGLAAKRDLLADGLEKAGFAVHRPDGTYFITADARSIGWDDGEALCRAMPERCGVVAVPAAAFYVHPERGRHLVRFAFCKRDEVLDEAVSRLARLP